MSMDHISVEALFITSLYFLPTDGRELLSISVFQDSFPLMRYLLSVLVFGLLLAPFLGRAQITKKVSEVTNTERFVSDDMRPLITESYPGHASFRAEYERPADGAPSWILSFYGFAEEPTAMNEATRLRAQVDGQSITPTQLTSKVRRLDDSIIEIKHATFTRSDFQKIATAEDVSVSIGSARFELTRPLREDLRLILDRIPAKATPQTASSDPDSSS